MDESNETTLVNILDHALRLMPEDMEERLAQRVDALEDTQVLRALLDGPNATAVTVVFACKVLRLKFGGAQEGEARDILLHAILHGEASIAFEAAAAVAEIECGGFSAAARTRLQRDVVEPFWLRDELQEIINNEEK